MKQIVKITRAIPCALIISGLIYIAISGWSNIFARPGVSIILAVALALPFMTFMHRAVKGCWVSWIVAAVLGAFIGTEGGFGVCENLKYEGGAREKELTAVADAKRAEQSADAVRAKHDETVRALESISEEVASLKAHRSTIALLSDAQRSDLRAKEATLISLKEAADAEAVSGKGNSWLAKQRRCDEAEASFGMTLAGIQELLTSETAKRAQADRLEGEIAGKEALLIVRKEAVAKSESALAATVAAATTAGREMGRKIETRHILFTKANEWAGGDMNKTLTILFAFGFTLMFTANLGAGLWMALILVPESERMKMFRVPNRTVAPEAEVDPDPQPEAEPEEENIVQFPDLDDPRVKLRAQNLDKVRHLMARGITTTKGIANNLGVSEATARRYKAEIENGALRELKNAA